MRKALCLRRFVCLLLLLVVAPVEALAHAQLLSTDPVDNAVLEAAPDRVVLHFNEPVSPLALKLVEPDGNAADLAGGAAAGQDIAVPMPSLGSGTHVLSWRVVSADGHPIAGALVFSVGQMTGAATAEAATDRAVVAMLWAGKTLLFVSMFVGVGGAVFAVVAPIPPAARRVATGLSVFGMLLVPATLALQGLDALGLPLPAIIEGRVWSAALSTSYGLTAVVAGAAFLTTLGSLADSRKVAGLGVVAGILAALSLALSGHAGAAAPQWLTRPAVFLHIAGILVWVGALLPLWLLLAEPSTRADRALAAFSRLAPYAVVPLVLAGLTLAITQMGAPGSNWLSPYAMILAAKLGLIIGLFALAVLNRWWLTTPALTGEPGARRRLRRSISLEMVLVVMILGLVAGWRFTPPPRALAPAATLAATDPVAFHLMGGETMAMVTVSPGRAGPATLDIALTDAGGASMPVQSIAVTLFSPTLGIEAIRRDAIEVDGVWRVVDMPVPVAGEWQLELEIRVDSFEMTRLEGSFTLP
ncbi:copper resistance protein CopC [Devosia nitrariae]|uniref:Copper resistance protein C n=1 Tax=Devosia nitrariae TaxID=2071872 RepID=A0ABQ5WAL4_9HYPH|nr:copper resistance protein CopC [Devosia nitrariae]GLQ57114.1 copper resistance protein C [Devosia nitrariae]